MQLNVIFTQISRMKILKVFFWKSGIPKKKNSEKSYVWLSINKIERVRGLPS